MVLDSAEDAIDGDLERSEVGINSVDFKEVPRKTQMGALLVNILPLVLPSSEEQTVASSSSLRSSAWEVGLLSFASSALVVLLLGSRQNVLHVSDIVLHQVFMKGMIDLPSGNQCGCDNIIITVINQYHLTLEITHVAFERFIFASS